MKGAVAGAFILTSILIGLSTQTDCGIELKDVPGILAIGVVVGGCLGAGVAIGGENKTKALGFVGGWFITAAVAAAIVCLMYLAFG
jgi:hypothetical protein